MEIDQQVVDIITNYNGQLLIRQLPPSQGQQLPYSMQLVWTEGEGDMFNGSAIGWGQDFNEAQAELIADL
jgi:hypothetical protein